MSTITDLRSQIGQYWSQSRVGLFLLCPLKYAFNYVYKTESEFTPLALVFGSAVHRTLEMMAYSRKDGSPMAETDCRELFGDIWQRQLQEDKDIRFGENQDAESCLLQGQAVIGVFHANIDPDEKILGVSEAMAVPLMNSAGEVLDDPLIGELALRVSNRDGKEVIVDWKTSARKWSAGKADGEIQPSALLYAYKQQYGRLPGFRYDIAIKTKTPGFQQEQTERGDDDFGRMVWIIEGIEKVIKADAFLPQKGFMCASCQYAGACARWHRQAERITAQIAA